MKNKRTGNHHEPKKSREVREAFIVVVVCGLVLTSIYFTPHHDWFAENTSAIAKSSDSLSLDDKCRRIGYPTNVQTWMKERHVSITEHAPAPRYDTNTTPIHIMSRTSETDEWVLRGTGGLLDSFPGYLITARHVMETIKPMQFGYRLIGPGEIKGTETIIPILETVEGKDSDDSIMCRYDTHATSFPPLVLVESPETFKDFVRDGKYSTENYPAHIRMGTSPDTRLDCLFMIHIRPDCAFIFTLSTLALGESGTVGIVEEETNHFARVVAIRDIRIPWEVYEKMPTNWQRRLDWNLGRWYGVFEMIQIK